LGSLTVDTYQKLQEELAILNSLPPHPNIIKVYRLLQTVHNAYIITEHCDRKITKNSDYDNLSIALGIIEGLKHLYKNNITHRDLKPDNILIKNGVAKIIDFGFAKNISGPFEKMNENLGTPLYMTPQIFDNMVYTSKCDIWSLGVTLHELVFKCDPYRAKDIEDLKRKIKTIQPPIFMVNNNDPLTNIIKRCLIVD
jgi:serine/threonine protein kinase